MSPRPRKASDAEILDATRRLMLRRAPSQWTLADVAREVGLTAGALVQRFGSRHALLVALTARAAADTPAAFAALRARHASPLAALRAYAAELATMGDGPGGLAHHLAYLQLDLTDADLHRHVRAQARATRAALRRLLSEAVAAGELPPAADPAALARLVEAATGGALLAWAIHREGTAARALRRDLDALLALAGAGAGDGAGAAAPAGRVSGSRAPARAPRRPPPAAPGRSRRAG